MLFIQNGHTCRGVQELRAVSRDLARKRRGKHLIVKGGLEGEKIQRATERIGRTGHYSHTQTGEQK